MRTTATETQYWGDATFALGCSLECQDSHHRTNVFVTPIANSSDDEAYADTVSQLCTIAEDVPRPVGCRNVSTEACSGSRTPPLIGCSICEHADDFAAFQSALSNVVLRYNLRLPPSVFYYECFGMFFDPYVSPDANTTYFCRCWAEAWNLATNRKDITSCSPRLFEIRWTQFCTGLPWAATLPPVKVIPGLRLPTPLPTTTPTLASTESVVSVRIETTPITREHTHLQSTTSTANPIFDDATTKLCPEWEATGAAARFSNCVSRAAVAQGRVIIAPIYGYTLAHTDRCEDFSVILPCVQSLASTACADVYRQLGHSLCGDQVPLAGSTTSVSHNDNAPPSGGAGSDTVMYAAAGSCGAVVLIGLVAFCVWRHRALHARSGKYKKMIDALEVDLVGS
jgi:hypothetical protein